MPRHTRNSSGLRRHKQATSDTILPRPSQADQSSRWRASSFSTSRKSPLRSRAVGSRRSVRLAAQSTEKTPPRGLYQPLDKSRRQFRLVRIDKTSDGFGAHAATLPGDSDLTAQVETPIRCHLEVFCPNATDTPDWQALSYERGEEDAQNQIEVNGHMFPVRPNLFLFLQQMVWEGFTSWIYIDAICINQDNVAEREQQVALMYDIYRGAELVIAWIPSPLWRVLVQVNNPLRRISAAEIDDDPLYWSDKAIRNSYWSRLWIVQEILLARRLVIRDGPGTKDLSELCAHSNIGQPEFANMEPADQEVFYILSAQSKDANRSEIARILQVRMLNACRQEQRTGSAPRHAFFQAVNYFSPQSCTRFHDRVYGISALSRNAISVDYSADRIELFISMWAEYLLSWGILSMSRPPPGQCPVFEIRGFQHGVAPFVSLGVPCTNRVVYTVALAIAAALCGPRAGAVFMMAVCTNNLAHHLLRKSLELDKSDDTNAELQLRSLSSQVQAQRDDFIHTYNDIITNDGPMTFHGIAGDVSVTKTCAEWREMAVKTAEGIWNDYLRSTVDDSARLIDDKEEWTLIA